MTYSDFTREVLKLSSQGLDRDDIAEVLAEQMEKDIFDLIPYVQKILMNVQIIHVK